MAGSTISNHVTLGVTLGSVSYPSPLTITSTGYIDPSAGGFYGATALVATISGGTVLNHGTVAGGAGATASSGTASDSGGIGVDLTGGSLTNAGMIVGGLGGYNTSASGGVVGGSGIVVTSGNVTNDGTILGGNGGDPILTNAGGSGGSGAVVTSSSLTNNGLIGGGLGVGYGLPSGPGGSGGDGVDASGSSLTNSGTIAGASGGYVDQATAGRGGAGVSLSAGSRLTNMGVIFGGAGGGANATFGTIGTSGYGVYAANSSLTNDGTISGGGPPAGAAFYATGGVVLKSGSLTNSGVINNGVRAANSVLGNTGAITGTSQSYGRGGDGVLLTAGSTLVNGGTITGGNGAGVQEGPDPYFFAGGMGVDATSSTLINNGRIIAGLGGNPDYSVYLTSGSLINNGTIENFAGGGVAATSSILVNNGTIVGTNHVVVTNSTLTNNGTIIGGIAFFGTSIIGPDSGRLIDDPGAVFAGGVYDQFAPITLELASAASAGLITGIGTGFTGFGTIAVDPHATWVVSGSVTGSGTFSLGAGSDLVIDNGVTATSPVHFTANTGTLGLGDPAGFASTVYGFQSGDAFDFTSITSTGSITAGVNASHDLTLTSNGILLTEIKLDPAQNFSGARFHAASDGGTGTLVTETPLCFLAGTLIATPGGEIPIEHLREGDMVVTARGMVRPVVWIGAGRVLATRGRRHAATPVIVRKGALADNVPHHDLRVTRAHALGVGGALIPVEFLINHRSIHWDDMAQEVALYHVELETHDMLLANGAPAESYRDDGNRWLFQNANSGWHLRAKRPCAPILTGGDTVDAAWQRLLERAGPRPGVPLTDDPDLHLLVDGGRVDAVSHAASGVGASGVGAFHVFGLTGAPAGARIASRAAVPQELGLARDPRRLGVALRRIIIRQGSRSRAIEADDALLAHGFHAFEAADGLRWTDGDAHLPAALFAGFDGPLEVVLLCGGAVRYVAEGAQRRAA